MKCVTDVMLYFGVLAGISRREFRKSDTR